jgi:hypothetical protein
MQAMQEFKAMWLHHKTIIIIRTHEATWPHHMPVFFNKVQGPSKTRMNCLMYCMHPFTKSLIQVFSKSLKIGKCVNCTVSIYKLNKMNFQQT